MKELDYDRKLELIKKYYKKNNLFFETYLDNYETYHIYIRLDYIKKEKVYKIIWYDLDLIESKDIYKYESTEYLKSDIIDLIKDNLSQYEIHKTNFANKELKEGLVSLYINAKTQNTDNINVKFSKYIPKELAFLGELYSFIFNNLPRKLEIFINELLAELNNNTVKFEYRKKFTFDLFNDNIDELFDRKIITLGNKYYNDEKVIYLEQIENKYFAVVEGTQKYVVIIYYEPNIKEIQFLCSCPCEFFCKHIYAVLKAIRNNESRRFFKVMYKNPNSTLMDRIMNFDYFLCTGVINNCLELINNNAELELLPILDQKGNNNWEVLEDTEDEVLTNEINKTIKM